MAMFNDAFTDRGAGSSRRLYLAVQLARTALADQHLSVCLHWAGRATILLFVAMTLSNQRLSAEAHTSSNPLLLTTIGQVHQLPPALASNASVQLVGTVTYYDPPNHTLFIQDATGGTFINTSKPYDIHVGDKVEVEGHTDPSYRTEVAMDPRIRLLGKGDKFPAPLQTYPSLVAGEGDSRLVTITGRVRAADAGQHANAPLAHLDVAMEGGEIEIYLNAAEGFNPESMLDSKVEITGVGGGSFDAKFQMTGLILYVAHSSMIHVLEKPHLKPDQLPLTDIDDVFQSLRVLNESPRVRVRGTLTYFRKGYAAVLEQNGKSIYVQTRETGDLVIGEVVDAFGFASANGYAPGLREAALVGTGKRAVITPQKVTYEDALRGLYSDNLIFISGKLVSQFHVVGLDTLVMDIDGHLVSAYFEGQVPLKIFLPGSVLRIQGICRVLPGNPWQAPYIFHLDMRTPDDIELLSRPSWWTIQHLTMLLSALALLAIAIAMWAITLRKRVIQQTDRIKRSMTVAHERSRILERITSNQSSKLILSEICKSVMTLLPHTICTYSLDPDLGTFDHQANSGAPGKPGYLELRLTGPDNETFGRVSVSASDSQPFSAEQKEIYTAITELATIATRQSHLYQELLHHSTHDALTELPNRRLCETRLGTALQEAIFGSSRLAVIYIDVNRFKQVNDKFGHKGGDAYLRQISARLLLQTSLTDTVARVGGDEFIVISPFADAPQLAQELKERLQASFNQPFDLEGEDYKGSASLGLAIYPEDGSTVEDLKRHADHMMYMAKRSANGSADPLGELTIITADELEAALKNDLFRLAYQPQFSAHGRLTGLEALLRLEDPILGTLTPDSFILAAERSDVILDLGMWVLRQSLQDAIRWKLHLGEEMVIAVNVAMRQLRQSDFASSVINCLAEYGFPASRLELEIVERNLSSTTGQASQQLEQLRNAGVRIALDDFGTGQSSLSVLHKLHLDTIKLDRSFIVAMDVEPKVIPIIEGIAFMSRSLGKRIVVEGIEHVGPVPALMKMGDLEFQGYLLSRPIARSEVDPLISTWRSGIKMPEAFRTPLRKSYDPF